MAYEIVVPRLGWSMDEGIFVEWLFEAGDFISKGSNLFVIEGDKAAEEIESFDEGILVVPDQAPKPGDTVIVGQVLGFLTEEGEQAPKYTPLSATTSTQSISSPETPVERSPAPYPTKSPSIRSERLIASPRARRAARAAGIQLSSITGTGRNGRIRERDVLAASKPTDGKWAALASQMPSGTLEAFTNRQLSANERLAMAVNQAVPVTLHRSADVTTLVTHREDLNTNQAEGDLRYSLGDLIANAVVRALAETPAFNSYFTDDGIITPEGVNLSVAMDTDDGLIVPVVNNAHTMSLSELATVIRELNSAANNNALTVEQLSGGTFTLTNLGMYGIEQFTPVLNVPQGAILGVGTMISSETGGKQLSTIQLSLTIDHRVHDGAPAARFLQTVCEKLSDWE